MEKFDKNSHNWREKNPNWNYTFLRNAEIHLNWLRVVKGYLYLRDVYEYLGLPCSLETIREKHLNDIVWTANEWFELEILQRKDYILIEFLNGVKEVKD